MGIKRVRVIKGYLHKLKRKGGEAMVTEKSKFTIGAIWRDREDGEDFELLGAKDGKVQISPLNGGDYRIMAERSLRTNYKLVALNKKDTTLPGPPEAARATPPPAEEQKAPPVPPKGDRAKAGHVKLADGTVIHGSRFITEICGKKREDTYKVDSPIRWLLKPAGQALLKAKGAAIVYGEELTGHKAQTGNDPDMPDILTYESTGIPKPD
jgi:hypothetical protein